MHGLFQTMGIPQAVDTYSRDSSDDGRKEAEFNMTPHVLVMARKAPNLESPPLYSTSHVRIGTPTMLEKA